MIEIGDYRLRKADELNWHIEKYYIQEKGNSKGEGKFKTLGYYFSFEKVVLSFTELLIKDGYEDTTDLNDVGDLIRDVKESILEQIKSENK